MVFSESKYANYTRIRKLEKEIQQLKEINSPDKFKNCIYTSKLIEIYTIGGYIIGLIQYPESKIFNGYKVVIWDKSEDFNSINSSKNIDPHFLENNKIIIRLRYAKNWKEIANNIVKGLISGD